MCNIIHHLSPKYNKYMQCDNGLIALVSVIVIFVVFYVPSIWILPVMNAAIYKQDYDMDTGCPILLNNCTETVKLFCYNNNLKGCTLYALLVVCALYGLLFIVLIFGIFITYLSVTGHSACKEVYRLNNVYEELSFSLNNLDDNIREIRSDSDPDI